MTPTPESAINRFAMYVVGLLMVVCITLAVAVAVLAFRLPGLTPATLPEPTGQARRSTFPEGVIAVDESAPKGDIAAVIEAQVDAWNQGNLDQFMQGYSKTDLVFLAGNDEVVGWQALRDRYQKRYGDKPKEMGTLGFSNLRVRMLTPETAQVRGKYTVTGGQKPGQGQFTLLMRNEADGWRIIHDHTSAAE
jgi:beta-aspartyl-peptidase (threonine type)